MTINKLPSKLPNTQSFFYMRIITYAYFLLLDEQNVPNSIIELFNELLELKNINELILNAMSNSVVEYLKIEDNLNKLIEYYAADTKPNYFINQIGHISADNQEKILEKTMLKLEVSNLKQTHLYYFFDSININVKDAIDYYLLITYYENLLSTDLPKTDKAC